MIVTRKTYISFTLLALVKLNCIHSLLKKKKLLRNALLNVCHPGLNPDIWKMTQDKYRVEIKVFTLYLSRSLLQAPSTLARNEMPGSR